MDNFKIVFVIDRIELKYFEFNKLVTTFWLIKECKQRNWDVFITTADKLYLNGNIPNAMVYPVKLTGSGSSTDIVYQKEGFSLNLNETDMIIFRPDPPVDMDYIFSTYILDYVDPSKTLVINSPSGIRKANEKLYINNFPSAIPENITTSNAELIKDFLENHGEVIVKPLNRCFGKGVFYLKQGDKNTNSILEMLTNSGTTVVMAQKYLEGARNGDKRVLILGGEILDQSVVKISGKGDFKFNTHNDEYLKKGQITDEEREMVKSMSPKLLEDGLFLVGLDVIDNKVIEINVTSPCFFIKEINQMFGIELEKRMVSYLENLLQAQKGDMLVPMV